MTSGKTQRCKVSMDLHSSFCFCKPHFLVSHSSLVSTSCGCCNIQYSQPITRFWILRPNQNLLCRLKRTHFIWQICQIYSTFNRLKPLLLSSRLIKLWTYATSCSVMPDLYMETFSTGTGLSQPMRGLLLLTDVGLFTCHLSTGLRKFKRLVAPGEPAQGIGFTLGSHPVNIQLKRREAV